MKKIQLRPMKLLILKSQQFHSRRDISTSILMQNFDIIIKYGGPSGMSRVSNLCPEYTGNGSLHFLKVELNGVAKALCEGVLIASSGRSTVKLEDMLKFGSTTENRILASLKLREGQVLAVCIGLCVTWPKSLRQSSPRIHLLPL